VTLKRIFHITSRTKAAEAVRAGVYVPDGFDADGFVHCSYARQVTSVADARFHGRSDLVLLEIDREAVSCEVRDENLEGGVELFPHVYGRIPMSAVVRIHQLPCRGDGRFDLPGNLPA
jgi:uncharacterized protein (DUF952 family)